MGKVVKAITKPIQKIIPKEIKPFLPALAAVLGPAAFASFSPAFASLPIGLQSAIISAGTSTLVEGKPDLKSAALSGIMAQAGSALKNYGKPFGSIGSDPGIATQSIYAQAAGSPLTQIDAAKLMNPDYIKAASQPSFLQTAATKVGEYLQPSSVSDLFDPNKTLSLGDTASALYSGAKASLPASTYAGAEKLKEIQEDELRKYNEQMRQQGVTDKAGIRKGIYEIYAGIEDEDKQGSKYRVYSDEYINSILDKYGYARGGIVGLYKKGGEVEKPKPVELPQDPLSKIIEEFIKDQKRQDEIRKQYKANGGRIGFNVGGSSDTEALAAEVKRLQIENEALRKGDKSSLKDLGTLTDYATKGFEMATGSPLGGAVAQPQRIIPGFARGGIADLETVAMEPVKTENVQVASPDLYVKLVEYYESLGYDYDTASDLAYKDYMSGAKKFEKGGKVMQASHSGNDKLTEQLYEEFLEMGMTPQQARQAVKDYLNSSKIGLEEGGKVIPMIPEGIFYKGKAKDYPGASKAIRDTLKEKREKKAEGGLLGLKKGGMPAEFDYRDGGIIKVGSKPKADDVPARLSLGEFVLTKESVDNLGKKITGKKDNRAGAEALYNIMDNLEAIA
jgi:hypothetical protein